MRRPKPFKLITEYGVQAYACGVKAQDKIRLRREIVIRYATGEPTGQVHAQGEIWTVLSGSPDTPGIVWLRDADGDRCTWSDDADFFEYFEVL